MTYVNPRTAKLCLQRCGDLLFVAVRGISSGLSAHISYFFNLTTLFSPSFEAKLIIYGEYSPAKFT